MDGDKGTVLVVDDDRDIREMLKELLGRSGYDVTGAANGQQALDLTGHAQPDLIILDVTMPLLDGWQTLERLRAFTSVPVLMLTARSAELEQVRGLQAGADDYITKPFGRQALLARVDALLRRVGEQKPPEAMYEDSLLTVDFTQARATVGGEEVSLTKLEFKLLSTFVRNPGQLLNHEQLLQLVWGSAHGSRDQVKLYVGYLRRKLGFAGDNSPISTVRGFGYRYLPPGDTSSD